MKNKIELSLVLTIFVSGVYAKDIQKEQTDVLSVKQMFDRAKVSGELRVLSSLYTQSIGDDNYATAWDGYIKYELAEFNGFSAGVSMLATSDIDKLSGKEYKCNTELSSQDGEYVVREESYINYKYNNFNLRVGRQIVETPLADSDDIRMVKNSFQAIIATYQNDSYNIIFGCLDKWQGVDAGLENGWIKTANGKVYFGGINYLSDLLDSSIWYYNINGEAGDEVANNTIYADLIWHFSIFDNIDLDTGMQYLTQNELDSSGVKADIVGLNADFMINSFGFSIAYNKSSKNSNKQSFSGFGGGTLFTNMDSMIIDSISLDRDANAFVFGLNYQFNDLSVSYSYGDFFGDVNSAGIKEHIVEQDIIAEYNYSDDIALSVIIVNNDDKYKTGTNGSNWNNIRLFASYNF